MTHYIRNDPGASRIAPMRSSGCVRDPVEGDMDDQVEVVALLLVPVGRFPTRFAVLMVSSSEPLYLPMASCLDCSNS